MDTITTPQPAAKEPDDFKWAAKADDRIREAHRNPFKWVAKAPAKLLQAIDWIAHNDNEGSGDAAEDIAGYLTTHLVADTWNIPREELAFIIRGLRDKAGLPKAGERY